MTHDYDTNFEDRVKARQAEGDWKRKGLRFLRYLSSRDMECWGFFAAGILVAKIIL